MNISCVIPTCNRNDFLREALTTVLEQTLPPFEIIIVQNGTQTIILPEEIRARVKIIDIAPFSGAARARNAGAEAAQGTYVAFLDDDDLWNSHYLERVAAAFVEGYDCVVSRLDKLETGTVSAYKQMTTETTIDDLLVRNPGITGSNIALSKTLFIRVGGFDTALIVSEDKSLIIEIMKLGVSLCILRNNSAIFRIHDGERLTESKRLAASMIPFLRKYRQLMRPEQYFFNLMKMYKYAYRGGEPFALVKWVFAKAAFETLRRFA